MRSSVQLPVQAPVQIRQRTCLLFEIFSHFQFLLNIRAYAALLLPSRRFISLLVCRSAGPSASWSVMQSLFWCSRAVFASLPLPYYLEQKYTYTLQKILITPKVWPHEGHQSIWYSVLVFWGWMTAATGFVNDTNNIWMYLRMTCPRTQ